MASSIIPPSPTAANVTQLLPKLYDQDPDFRYMALNDLHQIFLIAQSTLFSYDFNVCAKTVDGIIATLGDTHGDVQNMAIKCLGPFVNKAPNSVLGPMIEKVSTLKTNNTVDASIPAIALREIVVSLPRPIPGVPRTKPVQDAYAAISQALIPRLVGYVVVSQGRKDQVQLPKGMLASDLKSGTDSNAIDVLTEVARCFGPMLQEAEILALQKVTLDVLEHDKASSVLKKKAVLAISTLAAFFSDHLLSNFISQLIESFTNPHLTRGKRKLYITIVGSTARSIPRKFGPYLRTMAPFVLSALSAEELDEEMAEADEDDERDPEADEVREAALVAIDGFLAACSQDMITYTEDCITAAIRYLKYDPNLAHDDDDDGDEEEEKDEEYDEEFEEEGAYDDEDDASWKVRRCAAKVLGTLISTRSKNGLLEDGTLYERVAPALILRFKEREENVRVEVLTAMTVLVRNTGDGVIVPEFALQEDSLPNLMGPPPKGRKRRRGGSDASMFDSQTKLSLSRGYSFSAPTAASAGPLANLHSITPDMVRGIAQMLKTGPLATKQAVIILLKHLVLALHGGLSDSLDLVMDPIVDAIKSAGSHGPGHSSSSAVTANSLRIHALQLLGLITDLHAAQSIQPYFPKIVPAVQRSAQDKNSKVSSESLVVIEHLIKALTRESTSDRKAQDFVGSLYETVAHKASARDVDIEVRQRAVHVLGLLLGRTSSSTGLLAPQKRSQGLDLLLERLKNELTRLSAVKAVKIAVALAQSIDDLKSEWVQTVALELGAQLRKSSRSLRGAALSALKELVINTSSRQHLDPKTTNETVQLILPLVTSQDLHLLGPALVILATFVQETGETVVTESLTMSICDIAKSSVAGAPVDALLTLVQAIGEAGAGKSLMKNLLDLGIGGNSDLVGKLVGTLLVFGGPRIGVKLQDILKELKYPDDRKQSLAVTVLGEVGLRMGSESTLTPDHFIQCFSSKSELLPLAAAVALGRAGAANIQEFLPVILSTMGKKGGPQYLLLHSIKEILQQNGAGADIIPFADTLWQNIVAASQAEDNKAIGAECIGRLAILEPKTYLPQLETFLDDRKASARSMVISALRYTLADTDESYDDYLRPIVTDMLIKMLSEEDLENRRLALSTFNSAMHNKADLVLPRLHELLPLAMKETVIKPELIREVQMGPFKHKVDDGLEIRKSAYETLYSLLETAFSRVPVADLFDRVVAGVSDDHDVRALCTIMLAKLARLAPDETRRRLDALAQRFRAVLAAKPKDNAVKQEIEKLQDDAKGVLKASVLLNKQFADGGGGGGGGGGGQEDARMRAWADYWEWARKEAGALLKVVEEEMREKDV